MRQPLRRQLLLPNLTILATTLLLVTASHVWLTSRSLDQALNERMRAAARTLDEGSFPLEGNVLSQAQGLCGAEIAVSGPEGTLLAASSDIARQDLIRQTANDDQPQNLRALRMNRRRSIATQEYFYAVAQLERRSAIGPSRQLHLYFPAKAYRAARWRAIYPSLVIGGLLLAAAVGTASVLAARLTRPIDRLKDQTQRIAQGDFRPIELPPRDDELRDLALSVNRMAEMLVEHAEQMRRHERQLALHRLGSGIAHQLRNAATGGRIALDLFHREYVAVQDDENLQVVARQLELMEQYLQRFLVLGRAAPADPQPVEVGPLIESAVHLVRPLAEHLRVSIEIGQVPKQATTLGDAASLEQLLLNLLTNAVEACATPKTPRPIVRVRVEQSPGSVQITISDNGPGFDARMLDRLGEPFVTNKPQGTGLGLAVVKEIAAQHQGTIQWRRDEAWTRFILTLIAE